MRPSLRDSLAFAAASSAIAVFAFACTGGSGGNIGDPCQSINDCANQYECLPILADGGCSKPESDGAIPMTCQQTCTSNCDILEGNYTCSMGACGVPDLSAVCRPGPN